MKQVTIQKIAENNFAVLSALARRTFVDTFRGTCTEDDLTFFLDTTYSEDIFKAECVLQGTEIWTAWSENQIIAYIQMSLDNTTPELLGARGLEIQRLYVAPEHKGKGIGKTLMELAHQRADEFQSPLIWLGVWEYNYPALKFYTNFGFSVFSSHPFPIGNTAQTDLWMRKDLLPAKH